MLYSYLYSASFNAMHIRLAHKGIFTEKLQKLPALQYYYRLYLGENVATFRLSTTATKIEN